MTTARDIITGALTFGINRLSPGETLDNDVGLVCLTALNHLADEFNSGVSFLFREILTTSSAITGASAQLGTAWAGLTAGETILTATVSTGGADVPLDEIQMGEYALIPFKTLSGVPNQYAYDGKTTIYLYPAASAHTVTLLTKQEMSDFADLDTDYVMPSGYKSALARLLAEKLAPSLVGSIPPAVAAAAAAARNQLLAQNTDPAILGRGANRRFSVLTG